MQDAVPASPARAALSFTVLMAAMTAIGPLSIDMYLPSLPEIARDLHTQTHAAQATVAIFFVGMACGQLIYGPASDRLGRRKPILLGLGLYVLGSIASAAALSLSALLVARLAQALGACACMVIGRAVVRDHFDYRESARFFSLLALVAGIAPILAPLAGSLLLELTGWRAIFMLLTAFGASLWICVWLGLPESRSEAVAAQARQEHPLRSYVNLLRKRRLNGFLIAGALNGAAMFTYIASSPAVLIGVYHVSATQFGLLFGMNALGLIGASQLNRALLRRLAVEKVLRAAAAASAIAAGWLLFVAITRTGGLWSLLVPLFVTVSSASLIQANTLAGALSVDPTRAGTTSALFGASSFAAGALASSAAGALYDGTAHPMCYVIAICLAGCAATLYLLALRRDTVTAGYK